MVIHPTFNWPEYVHAQWCRLEALADQVGPVLYQLLVASITQGVYCFRVGALTQSKCAVALISMVSIIYFYHLKMHFSMAKL